MMRRKRERKWKGRIMSFPVIHSSLMNHQDSCPVVHRQIWTDLRGSKTGEWFRSQWVLSCACYSLSFTTILLGKTLSHEFSEFSCWSHHHPLLPVITSTQPWFFGFTEGFYIIILSLAKSSFTAYHFWLLPLLPLFSVI